MGSTERLGRPQLEFAFRKLDRVRHELEMVSFWAFDGMPDWEAALSRLPASEFPLLAGLDDGVNGETALTYWALERLASYSYFRAISDQIEIAAITVRVADNMEDEHFWLPAFESVLLPSMRFADEVREEFINPVKNVGELDELASKSILILTLQAERVRIAMRYISQIVLKTWGEHLIGSSGVTTLTQHHQRGHDAHPLGRSGDRSESAISSPADDTASCNLHNLRCRDVPDPFPGPITHEANFRWVRCGERLFALTSAQGKAVEALYQDYLNKGAGIDGGTLRDAAGMRVSKSTSLYDLFRNSPAWMQLVVPVPQSRLYRLNLQPPETKSSGE